MINFTPKQHIDTFNDIYYGMRRLKKGKISFLNIGECKVKLILNKSYRKKNNKYGPYYYTVKSPMLDDKRYRYKTRFEALSHIMTYYLIIGEKYFKNEIEYHGEGEWKINVDYFDDFFDNNCYFIKELKRKRVDDGYILFDHAIRFRLSEEEDTSYPDNLHSYRVKSKDFPEDDYDYSARDVVTHILAYEILKRSTQEEQKENQP